MLDCFGLNRVINRASGIISQLVSFWVDEPISRKPTSFSFPRSGSFFVGLLYYSWRVIFFGAWATEAVNGTPGPVRQAKAKVIALWVSVLGWQGRL